jgi:hypothetical protein
MQKILASFDNHQKGFSARKLSAFAMMWLIAYCHHFVDASNMVDVLMIDCAFVLLLLGIITMQQVVEFKNGNKPNNNEQNKTE